MQEYYPGDTVTKRLIFETELDVAFDPDAIAISIVSSAGIEAATQTISDLSRESPGVYLFKWNLPSNASAGTWTVFYTPSITTGNIQDKQSFQFEVLTTIQLYGNFEKVKRLAGIEEDDDSQDKSVDDALIDAGRVIDNALRDQGETVPLTTVPALLRTCAEYLAAGLILQRNAPNEVKHPYYVQGEAILASYIVTEYPPGLLIAIGVVDT